MITSHTLIYSNIQVFDILKSDTCIHNRTLSVGQIFLIGEKRCWPIDSNLRYSTFTARCFYACTVDHYGESGVHEVLDFSTRHLYPNSN